MQTLEKTCSECLIDFPENGAATEFEVQAEIYCALKGHGFSVRGEVNWADRKTREHCRFDLVIYAEGKPWHIVEIKARPVRHKNGVASTRQGTRYTKFGLPVSFVYGVDELPDLLRELVQRTITCEQ